nr:PREDICTED: uncharacterized protein LOC109042195 [Bemisia tabaci]
MYTGDYSLPTPTPVGSEANSPAATFQSPASDGQLAYLIQNRANDPCKVFRDQRDPDKRSHTWADSKMACEMAFLAYLGIIQQSHNKHQCPDAKEAECRLIMRSSTKVWEWTCTVKVRNHLCGAFLCCEPFRVEHLDYCVKTLYPAVILRSRRYDYNRNMGRSLSSSEGTPSKPTYIPEED